MLTLIQIKFHDSICYQHQIYVYHPLSVLRNYRAGKRFNDSYGTDVERTPNVEICLTYRLSFVFSCSDKTTSVCVSKEKDCLNIFFCWYKMKRFVCLWAILQEFKFFVEIHLSKGWACLSEMSFLEKNEKWKIALHKK